MAPPSRPTGTGNAPTRCSIASAVVPPEGFVVGPSLVRLVPLSRLAIPTPVLRLTPAEMCTRRATDVVERSSRGAATLPNECLISFDREGREIPPDPVPTLPFRLASWRPRLVVERPQVHAHRRRELHLRVPAQSRNQVGVCLVREWVLAISSPAPGVVVGIG